MAIAYDTTSNAAGASSWSHTCSGANRILFVQSYAINDTLTNITFDGLAMTLVGKTSFPGSGRQGTYLHYLINPPTGSKTISITGATGVAGVSFSGAEQSGQPDSSNSGTSGTSTSISASTTVVKPNCWLIMASADAAGGETAGSGTTIRDTDANGLAISDSNGIVGTGSQSLNVSIGSSSVWATVIASFSPADATATQDAIFFGHFA